MDDTSWSRAYSTVLMLAVVLLPIAGCTAIFSMAATANLISVLGLRTPEPTAVFFRLGVTGHVLVGAASLAVLIAMARWRDLRQTTVASAVVFVVCMGFYLFSTLASQVPFWGLVRM